MNVFLNKKGKLLGPFTADDLRQMLQCGEINGNERCWMEDGSDWIPAGELLGITATDHAEEPTHSKPQKNPSQMPTLAVGVVGLALVITFASAIYFLIDSKKQKAQLQQSHEQVTGLKKQSTQETREWESKLESEQEQKKAKSDALELALLEQSGLSNSIQIARDKYARSSNSLLKLSQKHEALSNTLQTVTEEKQKAERSLSDAKETNKNLNSSLSLEKNKVQSLSAELDSEKKERRKLSNALNIASSKISEFGIANAPAGLPPIARHVPEDPFLVATVNARKTYQTLKSHPFIKNYFESGKNDPSFGPIFKIIQGEDVSLSEEIPASVWFKNIKCSTPNFHPYVFAIFFPMKEGGDALLESIRKESQSRGVRWEGKPSSGFRSFQVSLQFPPARNRFPVQIVSNTTGIGLISIAVGGSHSDEEKAIRENIPPHQLAHVIEQSSRLLMIGRDVPLTNLALGRFLRDRDDVGAFFNIEAGIPPGFLGKIPTNQIVSDQNLLKLGVHQYSSGFNFKRKEASIRLGVYNSKFQDLKTKLNPDLLSFLPTPSKHSGSVSIDMDRIANFFNHSYLPMLQKQDTPATATDRARISSFADILKESGSNWKDFFDNFDGDFAWAITNETSSSDSLANIDWKGVVAVGCRSEDRARWLTRFVQEKILTDSLKQAGAKTVRRGKRIFIASSEYRMAIENGNSLGSENDVHLAALRKNPVSIHFKDIFPTEVALWKHFNQVDIQGKFQAGRQVWEARLGMKGDLEHSLFAFMNLFRALIPQKE